MLDLSSTLALSCLMTALSSKSRLRSIINTLVICLVYALGLGFALGLLFTTHDFIHSQIASFEWTLEYFERNIKYLFIATGVLILMFFSCSSIDCGLDDDDDDDDDVSTEVPTGVLPEAHLSDNANHDTTTQQCNKEPVTVHTMVPMLKTMVLQTRRKDQYVSPRKISQDFTINNAVKTMSFIEPSALLKTPAPNTMVLQDESQDLHAKSIPEVQEQDKDMTEREDKELKTPETMTPQTESNDKHEEFSLEAQENQKKDHCKSKQSHHREATVSKTMVPNTARLRKETKDQPTKPTKHPQGNLTGRELSRILLKDFLTLEASVKASSLEESEFLSEVYTYAQRKARTMMETSGASTPDSLCSSSSEELCFQVGVRRTVLSKSEGSRKRPARSTPESGLAAPESEFQAGLRTIMQSRSGVSSRRSGMSTPGSVSSSTSEESEFQAKFRKAMRPNSEKQAGSRRSSRPSTTESAFSNEESEFQAELRMSMGSRKGKGLEF